MVFRIELTLHQIARFEVHKAVGAGADRLEVGRGFA